MKLIVSKFYTHDSYKEWKDTEVSVKLVDENIWIETDAEKELDILIKTTIDAIIRDFIPEILALCEKFGESGQSGGSAPYTAKAISQAVEKLCL